MRKVMWDEETLMINDYLPLSGRFISCNPTRPAVKWACLDEMNPTAPPLIAKNQTMNVENKLTNGHNVLAYCLHHLHPTGRMLKILINCKYWLLTDGRWGLMIDCNCPSVSTNKGNFTMVTPSICLVSNDWWDESGLDPEKEIIRWFASDCFWLLELNDWWGVK